MPSLEQLRHEALAAEVDRLVRPRLLHVIGPTPDPLVARVELLDGQKINFRLSEVVLDGELLVGRLNWRRPIAIPLATVKTLWRRRYHRARTAAACAATMAATTLLLGGIASRFDAAVLVLGPMFGLILGGGVSIGLNQFRGMLSEWVVMYQRDQP